MQLIVSILWGSSGECMWRRCAARRVHFQTGGEAFFSLSMPAFIFHARLAEAWILAILVSDRLVSLPTTLEFVSPLVPGSSLYF